MRIPLNNEWGKELKKKNEMITGSMGRRKLDSSTDSMTQDESV